MGHVKTWDVPTARTKTLCPQHACTVTQESGRYPSGIKDVVQSLVMWMRRMHHHPANSLQAHCSKVIAARELLQHARPVLAGWKLLTNRVCRVSFLRRFWPWLLRLVGDKANYFARHKDGCQTCRSSQQSGTCHFDRQLPRPERICCAHSRSMQRYAKNRNTALQDAESSLWMVVGHSHAACLTGGCFYHRPSLVHCCAH